MTAKFALDHFVDNLMELNVWLRHRGKVYEQGISDRERLILVLCSELVST